MVRKGYTPEQIIGKLREAEILLNQGALLNNDYVLFTHSDGRIIAVIKKTT